MLFETFLGRLKVKVTGVNTCIEFVRIRVVSVLFPFGQVVSARVVSALFPG